MKKTLHLYNLDCANCANKIVTRIKKIKGVEQAEVDFIQKKLHLQLQDETLLPTIFQEVKKIEPDIEVVDSVNKQRNEKASPQNYKLYLEGIDCAACADKISGSVKALAAVQDVSINFSTRLMQVTLAPNESMDATFPLIKKSVQAIKSAATISLQQKKHKATGNGWKNQFALLIGAFIFIIANSIDLPIPKNVLFLLAYVCCGYKVLWKALQNILAKEIFDENFLMSIATMGALLTGSYKEAIAVMIFYEIGEIFQSMAVNRSRNSIAELMDLKVEEARILKSGKTRMVACEAIAVNDIILVNPGEKIALDGIILKGESTLDTSALSGESLPRSAKAGDKVNAGVVNLSGLIQVQVTSTFENSSVARILELVENASSKKAPIENFITKFSKIYTPIVVVLALLLAIIPNFIISDGAYLVWLYRALTFLVVACPCALVISIPLGMFAGIGAASRKGILIKGGNYLEALNQIDTIVFDKTGTLTKGVFKVVQIVGGEEVLKIAAYAEANSNHPIAQSILKAYAIDLDQSIVKNYEEIAGNGIHAQIAQDDIYVGNARLMEQFSIPYTKATQMGSIVYVAKNKKLLGYLIIADEIKSSALQGIKALRKVGIKNIVMLSGDRKEVGESVASQLTISEVHTQLLPHEKVAIMEEYMQNKATNAKIAFVGDGINDAPVLARSDIGYAMGGIGSDAAIEAADVVLMNDNILSIATSIQIAKKTKRIATQNIMISLGIKVIILILSALGYANMWMGVFADVGVTLLAILNAMRALRVKIDYDII